MEKIFIKALELADAKMIKCALINAVSQTDSNDVQRLVNVIFDLHTKLEDIPKTSTKNNVVRTLISYDPVRDYVEYAYEETLTKWFKTQEEADTYDEKGDYYYGKWSENTTGEYNFCGVHTFQKRCSCSLYSWM